MPPHNAISIFRNCRCVYNDILYEYNQGIWKVTDPGPNLFIFMQFSENMETSGSATDDNYEYDTT